MYLNCSLSPTATLYELGLEGMADQKPLELVPMVTVVVATASVAAELSSAASAERMRSAKRKDRMCSVGLSVAHVRASSWLSEKEEVADCELGTGDLLSFLGHVRLGSLRGGLRPRGLANGPGGAYLSTVRQGWKCSIPCKFPDSLLRVKHAEQNGMRRALPLTDRNGCTPLPPRAALEALSV